LRTLAAKNGKVISADKLGKLKTFLQMMLLLVSALIWMQVIRQDTMPAIWIMRVLIGGVVVVTVVSGANYFIKNRDLIAEKQ
jgi:phosphatidylglycerophosphate synthase